ncbi:TerB family tellurite resistance protein [Microcoleus sp. FACHB-1515]|uniref:tellurite resistance TerB family protein n=1 Tax=Cyanophyceae TaxID=3028117 RepID=UPI0016842B7E|nr:TerB family tellurite resistance protein [Microcoleus sp. FACHB-1515]MBD2091136.1 TerB family tellurite resistance protein [Microcoleus sp. FACHB-1515]
MVQMPSPSISPRQMNLLRIVTSMAWSDGNLSEEEVDVMLDRFVKIFAPDSGLHERLSCELRDYLMQNIPLSELTPKLQSDEERELVLQLGYEVIRSSARNASEDLINEQESAAFQKLVQLLNLPAETVDRVQAEVAGQTHSSEGMVDSIARKLQAFVQQ